MREIKKIVKLSIIIFLIITPILAFGDILPKCANTNQAGTDLCGLCDVIGTGINIFRWILGMLGGAALLLFVWHGFGWITSGGNTEKIEKSKKGLMHTVIGILIILGSWMIVNITITLLTAEPGPPPKIGTIFTDQPWNKWSQYCP